MKSKAHTGFSRTRAMKLAISITCKPSIEVSIDISLRRPMSLDIPIDNTLPGSRSRAVTFTKTPSSVYGLGATAVAHANGSAHTTQRRGNYQEPRTPTAIHVRGTQNDLCVSQAPFDEFLIGSHVPPSEEGNANQGAAILQAKCVTHMHGLSGALRHSRDSCDLCHVSQPSQWRHCNRRN